MHATTTQLQGRVPVTVLTMHGDLDGSSYQYLVAQAREAYASGARNILLDLSDVPYMSSAGLMALHMIAAQMRGDAPRDVEEGWAALHSMSDDPEIGFQRHFKLLNPQPHVDQVLETVGFKLFLEVYTDRDAAVASF